MRRNRLLQRTLVCASLVAVVSALAGSVAQGQGGVTITGFPTELAAGPDYATDVLGDPWDMCNPEDISPFPMEVVGFASFTFSTAPCRAGGTINGADASVAFLYRGNSVTVNAGRNGRHFPIDTTKYQILSYKLNSNLAGQDPQIYWYHNSYQDPSNVNDYGVRYAPPTVNGTQIATANLGGAAAQGSRWDAGAAVGLRFDPNNVNAGQNVSFRWVRLTSATSIQRINFTGGSGLATITATDTSDGTVFTIAVGVSGSFYDWNYGVLPPGNYTLTVTKTGGPGSVAFTINHPPTIQVTDPSPTTGEDFATRILGNAWDMSQSTDLQYTGVEHTTAVSFSGGVASATNTTNDPNVTLLYTSNNAVPIDTSKYRYLTYRMAVDGAFDLGLGSVARVLWSTQNHLSETTTTTSKDIIVWPGWNTYTFDLALLSTAAQGGGLEPTGEAGAWGAGAKRNLRLDPHEFVQARGFHIDDVKLTAKPVASGFFTIRYAGSDADGDSTSVALYYDTDTNATNGKTAIASGLALGAGQFGWNTGGVPVGDYYIYAEAYDGFHTVGRYSTVPVQVTGGGGVPPPPGGARAGDFDGDGATDLTVFRPSNTTWYSAKSSTNYTSWTVGQWGVSGDLPVPGDYDGDGRIDNAVYRPSNGTWYMLKSSTNNTTWVIYNWGVAGDKPVPGDYDGDGRTDMAVYRPSNFTWYILKSSTNFATWIIYQWGGNVVDVPVQGDYDGDGKTDMAVYRSSNGTWYILKSSTNYTTWIVYNWGGTSGDIAVPGDYDGDLKTDMAIYRSNGNWYLLKSSTNYGTWTIFNWGGTSGDIPVPGDYDGDRKTDMAVFRPASQTWYLLKSSTNNTTWVIKQWGTAGDTPISQK